MLSAISLRERRQRNSLFAGLLIAPCPVAFNVMSQLPIGTSPFWRHSFAAFCAELSGTGTGQGWVGFGGKGDKGQGSGTGVRRAKAENTHPTLQRERTQEKLHTLYNNADY